jgi:Trk-type K+ transport system membrane component
MGCEVHKHSLRTFARAYSIYYVTTTMLILFGLAFVHYMRESRVSVRSVITLS